MVMWIYKSGFEVLNLRNERIYVFKKTLKQRTVLVAVSSLTAGLLSILGTPTANAAVTVANKFSLAIGNSDTGTTVVTAGGGDTTNDKSVGFVAVTSAASANQEAVAAQLPALC